MTQWSDAFDTVEAKGNREDLTSIIVRISPTETPLVTAFGRGSAKATTHEWQTDALAAHTKDNAAIEGDDIATTPTLTPTVRVSNQTQILRKLIAVTGTQERVEKAGRSSEIQYQVAKAGEELKRDLEASVSQNNPGVTGLTRKLCSAETWIMTNDSRGAGGADGSPAAPMPTTAPTDGTQRALTEALLKGVIQSVWTEGGKGELILAGPKNKQNISAFTGNATRFVGAEEKELVAGIDWYTSDFGRHKIVPSRFNRDRSVLILTSEYWALSYLRPFHTV